MSSTLLVIGHRGASGTAPENTLASFRRAARQGADGIELDVRLTRDERLVVFHDSRLGRTAPGRQAIRKMTAEALTALDAGSWFHRAFSGERIPLLTDVLRTLPRTLMVNIEVKTDGDTRRRGVAARVLADELSLRGGGRPVVVTSFDHTFLKVFHAAAPRIPLGALYMPVRDAAKLPSRLRKSLGVSTFVCSRAQLRGRHAADARKHGVYLAVYGVVTREQLARVRRLGADAVITDYPSDIIRMLRVSSTP